VKVLIQRVCHAEVSVSGEVVGRIERGILVFVGVERGDDEALTSRLAQRLLNYRVFADRDGKTNLSVRDIGGGVLLVSQFTLAAETRKGLRPGFSRAALPEQAQHLYQCMLRELQRDEQVQVASGIFAADMQVSLTNDGPVTILLES
jgi:D-aminoacyl-tRNA deacylase